MYGRAKATCLRRGRSTPAMRAISKPQPCRCLWRGFSQMIRTTPLRRTTLHLSQIFLTLGRTFICLLMAVGDAAATWVVRAHFDSHAVTGQNPNIKLPHTSADCSEHDQPVVTLHTKHRVRQRLLDDAIELE